MKKRAKVILISIALIVVMVCQPTFVLTAYSQNIISQGTTIEDTTNDIFNIPETQSIMQIIEKNSEVYGHRERLFEAEETLNELKFLNENGTVSAYIFDYPVKYVDDNGIIKDKSNKLYDSKRSNYLYVNNDNDIKTYFPKKITKKPIIIEAGGFSMEMGIITDSQYAKKGEKLSDNFIFYKNAFGNSTAIRYQPEFNGYKEEIILYNADAPNSYSFEIKCEGLHIVKEQGILKFVSKNNGKEVFHIDPFYIYDSADNINSYVDTDYSIISQGNDEYLLTISLSKEYLNLKELTYPIYIDPAIKYNTTSQIDDVPIYQGKATNNYGTAILSYIGKHSSYGAGRMLLRFSQLKQSGSVFNSLTEDTLISAKLYLYLEEYGEGTAIMRVYQFGGSSTWTESGATWNNVNADAYTTPQSVAGIPSTASGYCSYDITSIVNTWLGNSTSANTLCNQGLIVKNDNETNLANTRCIRTMNFGSSTTPYILVNYSLEIPNGIYYIQNAETELFVETENNSTQSGVPVQLGTIKNNSTDSLTGWRIKKEYDGYYSIRSELTGKYIGVQGASTLNNAPILQYPSYSGDDTKWTFHLSSSGKWIISAKKGAISDKVLNIPSNTYLEGTDLIQYSYTNSTNYKDEWNLFRAAGTDLGELYEWRSDVERGSLWLQTPTIYAENKVPGGGFLNFEGTVNDAVGQWNNELGLSINMPFDSSKNPTTDKNSAKIKIYGLTLEQYEKDFAADYGPWNATNAGNTHVSYYQDEYLTAEYGDKSIDIYFCIDATVFVLYNPDRNTAAREMNLVLHELGHALGYEGHNIDRLNVMYYASQDVDTLTYYDIQHLAQIYSLVKFKP